MARYRLTHAARLDIIAILGWSEEQFGTEARERYQALITTALRDAASPPSNSARPPVPSSGPEHSPGTCRAAGTVPRAERFTAHGPC